ncbi:hypothetical protein [Desulfovibrio sp. Fe33]|uniref:hypothetical protein n=1 Tax=Desulfovibrio sp. Fe33 TaxID=3020842 RepID=UPI00234CE4AC|nr:hypothetical protein [Desulfovibrio sp. Fe33]
MAHLFLAVFASFVLAVAWEKMWRKSLLDDSRDRLFDLRDESRQWFLENGYTLDNNVYQSLRSLLNAHIRHCEDLTLTRYVVTTQMYAESPKLKENLDSYLQASFWTEDEKINDYVAQSREKASMIVMDHMMKGSFFIALPVLAAVLVMFVLIMGRALWASLRDCRLVTLGVRRTTVLATVAALIFMLPYRTLTIHPNVARYFGQQQIEIYSARG